MKNPDFLSLRERMVSDQLIARGIKDARVLEAMRKIPRHEFIPEESWFAAYNDGPVAIGEGQTISQPYIVALMTEALGLQGSEQVLEIGTGSGYQTAVLAELVKIVHTAERVEALSLRAQKILKKLGFKNIVFHIGDESQSLDDPKIAFDAIIVTAALPLEPTHLLKRLKANGRLVVPIGTRESQELTLITKTKTGWERQSLCQCMFVPLIGQYGFSNFPHD